MIPACLNRILFLVFIFCTLFAISAYSQNTWSVIAGGGLEDRGLVIRSTLDGGAIASGGSASFIVKFDPKGRIQWFKKVSFGPPQSIFALKNGYIISDRRSIFKLDLQGNPIWNYRYDTDSLLTPLISVAGGYVFASWKPEGKSRAVKIDSTGKVVWAREYQSANCPAGEFPIQLQKAPAGNMIFAGSSICSPYVIRFIKIDSIGKVIWKRDYQTSNFGAVVSAMKRTLDGGHVVAADLFGPGDATLLMKLNTDGRIEWQKIYSKELNVRSILLRDGGYIILANSTIFQVENDGTITNGIMPRFVSDHGESGFLNDLQRANGGGYLAAGEVHRPTRNFSNDLWFLKLDSSFQAPDAPCIIFHDEEVPATQQIPLNAVDIGAIRSRRVDVKPVRLIPSLKMFLPVFTECK